MVTRNHPPPDPQETEHEMAIERPPRLQPPLPMGTVQVPLPPDPPPEGQTRLIQIGLPLLTIIGYILVYSLGSTGRNPLMFIPMALSVIASSAFAFYIYQRENRRREQAERDYDERLASLVHEMHEAHQQQRAFYSYNYPSASELYELVVTSRETGTCASRSLRSELRLWERRPNDFDFGVVRLGVGTLPTTRSFVLEGEQKEESAQLRTARKLVLDSRFVSGIPMIVGLRPVVNEDDDSGEGRPSFPASHALALVGQEDGVYGAARAMIAHFATFHAPTEAQIYLVASHENEWSWVRSLPHIQGENGTQRMFIADLEQGDEKQSDQVFGIAEPAIDQFLDPLRRMLSQRRIQMVDDRSSSSEQTSSRLPMVVLVLDLLRPHDLLMKALSNAAVALTLDDGAILGAAVIFLVPSRSQVPDGCGAVIEVDREHDQSMFRYAEIGVNSIRYIGSVDILSQDVAASICAGMRTISLQRSASTVLPRTVLLRQIDSGFNSDGSTPLTDQITHLANQRWLHSLEKPGPPRLPIGQLVGGKTRVLTLDRGNDGVHGMIAGSTGSGKSVLLATIVVGLALNMNPEMLNFVLVDYKGGGTFNDFEDLPHCVELATNLAPERTARMFTAIRAEISRRQRILGGARAQNEKVENILDYHSYGFHKQLRLPFLMIIIDEFAEMLAANDESKAQLEQITRVGRSLGVFLLLASQNPHGVTDQMRSNITYRICLRVEQREESNEILRRDAAAFLPPGISGRGYLQVGNDDIELIQVAYVGEPVLESAAVEGDVLWEDDINARGEPKIFAKLLIEALQTTAVNSNIAPQEPPWPPFLPDYPLLLTQELFAPYPRDKKVAAGIPPERAEPWRSLRSRFLSADQLAYGDRRSALSPAAAALMLSASTSAWNDSRGMVAPQPVIGVVDDVEAAQQFSLQLAINQGHTLVVGATRSGKTTLLRTTVVSLAAAHSPAHLHMYLLDLSGSSGLRDLERLPHVGGRIDVTERTFRERIDHLLSELYTEIEKRRVEQGARSAQAGRSVLNQPWLVVIIDGIVALTREMQRSTDETDGLMSRFEEVLQNAQDVRIRFVIGAVQIQDVPGGLTRHITQKLALRLNDPADYRELIGMPIPQPLAYPGRGVMAHHGKAVIFQVALASEPRDEMVEPNDSQWITDFVTRVGHLPLPQPLPFRIDPLDKSIKLRDLLAHQPASDDAAVMVVPETTDWFESYIARQWRVSISQLDWPGVPIGVLPGGGMRRFRFDQREDGVHAVIGGGTGSGKSGLLATLVTSLAIHYDPRIVHLALIDFKGGATFAPFRALPHCIDFVTNARPSDVQRVFTAIDAEIKRRSSLMSGDRDSIVKYNQVQVNKGKIESLEPHLFIIIDEYMELVKSSPEFIPSIEKITRLGRAVGIHLIIAAQRPEVNDQMRANMSLKVALRVDDPDASRQLLRRTDAAHLPRQPGRGYIQIGLEQPKLFQVAQVDDPVDDPSAIHICQTNADKWVEGDRPSFAQYIINQTRSLYRQERGESAREFAPWPPMFPIPLRAEYMIFTRYFSTDRTRDTATEQLLPLLTPLRRGEEGQPIKSGHLRSAVGLLDDPRHGYQDRFEIDLSRGNLIIFGAAGSGKTTFLRTLTVSLAAEHFVGQLHIHVIDATGQRDTSLSALPHVGTCIIDDADALDRVNQFVQYLYDELSQRSANTAGEHEAVLLVLIDGLSQLFELLEEQPDAHERDGLVTRMQGLLDAGPSRRIWFVATEGEPDLRQERKLYRRFAQRMALRLREAADYQAAIQISVDDIPEQPGRGYWSGPDRTALSFEIAQIATAPKDEDRATTVGEELKALSAIGQTLKTRPIHGQSPIKQQTLATEYTFWDMLSDRWKVPADNRAALLATLETQVTTNAAESRSNAADWLKACVGLSSGDRLADLRFDQRYSGIHCMIAGGTGSGKSELLRTLVLDLALRYPPDVLSFALVDFKGGGSFEPFKALPHCAELITNLDAAAVERFFVVLEAEIKRRQELNKVSGCDHIVDFRRKRATLGADWSFAEQHYPHLFVIIDEYTELIERFPESRDRLESLTRVGRSLGISLILAAQRTASITNEMDANIKLRICLRVEQVETSRLLIRRPDAALLPPETPSGRGYIHQGGRTLDLVQVAYPSNPVERKNPAATPDDSSEVQPVPFYTLIVERLQSLHSAFIPRPWPEPLPDNIALNDQVFDGVHPTPSILVPDLDAWAIGQGAWPEHLSTPPVADIGLYDAPNRRERGTLSLGWDHIALFGRPRSGRSATIRSLIFSLVSTHAPQHLHITIVDSGGNFADLAALPHIGAIIERRDPQFDERLMRLIAMIETDLQKRQSDLQELDFAASLRNGAESLPAMLVAIDGFATLKDRTDLVSRLTEIARHSPRYGIVLMVTATSASDIPPALRDQLNQKLALSMEDAGDYKDLLGASAGAFAFSPGRGYGLVGDQVRMFQVAQAPQSIKPIIAAMKAAASSMGLPSPVVPLTTDYQFGVMLAALEKEPQTAALQIPIGLGERDRQPLVLDVEADGQHIIFAGNPQSGRTTALRTAVLSLASRYAPEDLRIALIDTTRKLATTANRLANLPHVYQQRLLEEPADLVPLLSEQEYIWRSGGTLKRLVVVIDDFDEFVNELYANKQIKDDERHRMVMLVRRASDYGITMIVSVATQRTNAHELYKAVRDSGQGIGLRSEEAAGTLGGIPRTEQRLLAVGRGFHVIRKVRVQTLQIAIVGAGTPEDYSALVQQLVERFPFAPAPVAVEQQESEAIPAPLPLAPQQVEQIALLRRAAGYLFQLYLDEPNSSDSEAIANLLKEYHALLTEPDDEQRMILLKRIWLLIAPSIRNSKSILERNHMRGIESNIEEPSQVLDKLRSLLQPINTVPNDQEAL